MALWSAAGPALALDPTRTIAQLSHTTWTLAEGAPAGVQAIAQSKDGYLWLGTNHALYRFDGVTFEQIPSYDGPARRSDQITALLAAKSGEIWVGHFWGGISVYRDGKLQDANPGTPHGIVFDIVQLPDGAIWVATDGARGTGLARFANGHWDTVTPAWGLPKGHYRGILAAKDGSLWVRLSHDVVRLAPGSRTFQVVDTVGGDGANPVETTQGQVWLAGPKGVRAATTSRSVAERTRGDIQDVAARDTAILDRDGGLWTITKGSGVTRLAAPFKARGSSAVPKPERFGRAEGIAPGAALIVAEDREGDIWIGTTLGLSRIRPANVVTEYRLPSEGDNNYIESAVTETVDGIVYGGTTASGSHVYQIDPFVLRALSPRNPEYIPGICPDQVGGIWIGSFIGNLTHVLKGRPAPIGRPPGTDGGQIGSCTVDGLGRLWTAVGHYGLYRYDGKAWTAVTLTPDLKGAWPWPIATDARGRVVMYFGTKSLMRVDGDRVQTLWEKKDISVGFIHAIYRAGNAMLLGGEFGLARLDGDNIEVLKSKTFPFLGHVSGIVQTSKGQTWLIGSAGIVQLASSELDRAFRHPGAALHPRIFGPSDGLPGFSQDGQGNDAAEAAGGRLWFATRDGIVWLDPNHLYRNMLAPPVSIRSLTANGVTYQPANGLKLPSHISNLQIDYAALSLQAPERVMFRYRLDGVDKTWIDPGSRRQAFYTDLRPRTYIFHVIAANNDGVWNDTGASLTFTIQPTFVQSKIFLALCIAAGAALLWCLYTLRLRQIASRVRLLMTERLAERERIARELHDTFLQSTQGLILRFQAVANRISPDQPAAAMMEQALARADEVLAEGRERVVDLRSPMNSAALPQMLEDAARRILAESSVEARIVINGKPRRLEVLVSEEITRIGDEFLFNTLKHAKATNVEIEIRYERKQLVVRFSDDGVGIDPAVLRRGSRDGHFGLLGMRERAQKLRAAFTLASGRSGLGTELLLVVPGNLAYVNIGHFPFPWRLSASEAGALEGSDL